MRIVHVVRQFHPSVGGMEEVVLNLARRHRQDSGDDVEVVTLDRLFSGDGARLARHEVHDGVPVTRLPYRGSSRYPLAPSVLAAIRGADVVHVHGIDFFYDFLAWSRPLHGIPLVASTHGGFFHTAFASRLKRLWFATITRLSALAYRRIIATSENDGAMFSGIVAPDRLTVIQNGVDVDKFAGKGSAVPGKTAIYFGRWSVNKGLPEMLEMFQHAVAADPEWRLIVAGRPYDLDRLALRNEITRRGLLEHVEVVASPSQAQLVALLARAQYFLCLSRHEGFGIAAVEAMSAGLMPVLSDIPPFARLIGESGIGLLADTANPAAAAAALRALAAVEPAQFQSRRAKAMAYAARYDWDDVVRRYRQEYDAIVPAARTEPA